MDEEVYLGTIRAVNRRAAVRYARKNWPYKVITHVRKVRGTTRYNGEYKVYGRRRK